MNCTYSVQQARINDKISDKTNLIRTEGERMSIERRLLPIKRILLENMYLRADICVLSFSIKKAKIEKKAKGMQSNDTLISARKYA